MKIRSGDDRRPYPEKKPVRISRGAELRLLAAVLLSLFGACRFAEELSHMSPPAVRSWQPGGDTLPGSPDSVALCFSDPMDRNLTEKAFLLCCEGESVEGVFSWETDGDLSFTPREGFRSHRLYELSLSTDAEDRWGNSLETEWTARFRTGDDQNSPRVLSTSPEDCSIISDPRQSISYVFSEAVERQSFRKCLSISPALLCVQQWAEDSRSVVLQPLEDYKEGEEYRFTLGTELTDLAGHEMAEPFIRIYPVFDPGKPVLDDLIRQSNGAPLSEGAVNDGLEKDAILQGRINRSLSSAEKGAFLTFSPDIQTDIDWSPEGNSFTLSFPDPPAWESCFTLSAGEKEFLLRFDGPASRPPEILSLHFCADADSPASDEPRALVLNGALGACDSGNAFLDIRIALAETAVLNISSLLDDLGISSPVLTAQGLGCIEYHEGMTPPPALAPGPGECLYRIILGIETTGLPGSAVISLEGSLADSRNNIMGRRYALTVCQP